MIRQLFSSITRSSLNSARKYCAFVNETDALKMFSDHLEIGLKKSLKVHYFWLRDHCRCQQCYISDMNQRTVDILDLPLDIQPESCSLQDNELIVTWKDGHKSNYCVKWLNSVCYENYIKTIEAAAPILWNADTIQNMDYSRVNVEEYMNTDEGLNILLRSLVKYGIGFVTGVEPTMQATQLAIERIGAIQMTALYGGMWQVTSDMSHSDTAYTTLAIGAHHDNTYWSDAAGLQVFHMLGHEGSGGETLLVDGFKAADDVRRESPDLYNRLATVSTETEYIEPGYHYALTAPIIIKHPLSGLPLRIRFNLLDRAPLRTVPFNEQVSYYRSLRSLTAAIQDRANTWWLKLEPGSIIFIDNWRVLHGRGSFTGKRTLCGAYVDRKTWMSSARVRGIINHS